MEQPEPTKEITTDELAQIKQTLAERDIEFNTLKEENSKLRKDLDEMHKEFKNRDVEVKTKTLKDVAKELMG